MALSLDDIRRGTAPQPPNILVHGVAGVGKTTFGAGAPAPILIRTEDGLGVLDVPHFPLAESFEAVMDALEVLRSQPHEFQTVVIDSIDWLEPLVWQEACRENNWKTIE
ncbi:MAG: hypothetical protein PsegKO_34790 [Pseudohongiellaceae bacterium]